MKRILKALLCLCLVASARAQFITVLGSTMTDSSNNLVTNATITFAPVLANGQPASYRKLSNAGQGVITPVSAQVVNGAFSMPIADSDSTTPVHLCYNVTVTDNVTGANLLGSGYSCVQPSGSATWCGTVSGLFICNFDAYPPNVLPLAQQQSGPTGPPGPPLVFGGTWSSGVSYSLGEVVVLSSQLYISLIAGNMGNNPTLSSTWAPVSTTTLLTQANCSSSSSPAACGTASAGMFVVSVGSSFTDVNTTAVTAHSEILITPDSSLGSALGVTCNTAIPSFDVNLRNPSSGFGIGLTSGVTGNPQCFSYLIIN